MALFRADPHRLGLLAAALHFAHARWEMWSRLARGRVKFVLTSHPSHGPEAWLEVRYTLTKSASRGIVKAALVPSPRWLWDRLLRRARTCPPTRALFADVSASQFERFIAPMGLSLHSFRRGAIQRSLDAGVAEEELCRLTTHSDVKSLLDYADRPPAAAYRAMRLSLAAQLGTAVPEGTTRTFEE